MRFDDDTFTPVKVGLYPLREATEVVRCIVSRKLGSNPYLIFVTNTTNISVEKNLSCGEKFKFLHMTDVEESKFSPHVE